MVSHTRKIFSLFKPTAEWFNDAVRGSGLSGLFMTGYTTISHGMQGAFVERWNKETSSFHLPVGEMTITLHDVQCLLHLPIRGPLLDHSRIQRVEAIEWMTLYLGMEEEVAHFECATMHGDVTWRPFADYAQVVPFDGVAIYSGWLACGTGIMVRYLLERCMRQFGFVQIIPRSPFEAAPDTVTRVQLTAIWEEWQHHV